MVHPVNGEVLQTVEKQVVLEENWQVLAVVFPPFRTALGKLRITGLLAQFDIARSFPQFPRPLLLQPTILTSERGTRFGIRKVPTTSPPPHLPDDPEKFAPAVRKSLSVARGAGVTSTPTFLLGYTNSKSDSIKVAQSIRGAQSYNNFKRAIDSLLKKDSQ